MAPALTPAMQWIGNAILLEDAEHADVRQAAREPSAQRQSQPHGNRNRGGHFIRSGARPAAEGGLPTLPRRSSSNMLDHNGLPLSWMRTHSAKFPRGCLLLPAIGLFQCARLRAGAFLRHAGHRAIAEKLTVLGSVLMIAAHPDDENTAILAYYARGRHMRTGYFR
jgi:hypothetical protein